MFLLMLSAHGEKVVARAERGVAMVGGLCGDEQKGNNMLIGIVYACTCVHV